MNLPYEDLRGGYELIAPSLRDGVVILDTAVIKQPSLTWAEQYLGDEHHLIGFHGCDQRRLFAGAPIESGVRERRLFFGQPHILDAVGCQH